MIRVKSRHPSSSVFFEINLIIRDMRSENEIWKPVVGYEGLYEVSNYGRIRSIDRVVFQQGRNQIYRGRIMATFINNSGYEAIRLSKGNKKKWMLIHRIVAEAFLPNPNSLPYVNHKDETKTNNSVDNLEWCSLEYNVNYGTSTRRRSIKMGKRIYAYSLKGEFLATYFSIREAERVTGVKKQNIMSVIDKNKTAGEMFWRTYMSGNIETKAPKNHKLHIVQYDMQSKKISSYSSAREAERETGIKHEYICKCIHGVKESCGGFIWRKAYG